MAGPPWEMGECGISVSMQETIETIKNVGHNNKIWTFTLAWLFISGGFIVWEIISGISVLNEYKIKNEQWYWYFFNKPAGLNFSQVLLSIIYIIIYIQQSVINIPRKTSHTMYGELIWADNLECGNLPLQLICHQWSWVTFLVEPDRSLSAMQLCQLSLFHGV